MYSTGYMYTCTCTCTYVYVYMLYNVLTSNDSKTLAQRKLLNCSTNETEYVVEHGAYVRPCNHRPLNLAIPGSRCGCPPFFMGSQHQSCEHRGGGGGGDQ